MPPGRLPSERAMLFSALLVFFFFLPMLCSLQLTKGSEVRALKYLYRAKNLSPPPPLLLDSLRLLLVLLPLAFVPHLGMYYCIVLYTCCSAVQGQKKV